MCDTAISVSPKGRATRVPQIENLHRQHQSEEPPPCKDHNFKKITFPLSLFSNIYF